MEEAVIFYEIMKSGKKNNGYDIKNGTPVEDMIKSGIIDPLKVTRTALENAVSVAAILLTTEVAITDKPEEKHNHSMPAMPGGMGGMM